MEGQGIWMKQQAPVFPSLMALVLLPELAASSSQVLAGSKWSSFSIFLAGWQACLLAIGPFGGQLYLVKFQLGVVLVFQHCQFHRLSGLNDKNILSYGSGG